MRMRITFLHPDLGIGGAERLVVDAALALRSKGHHISIVTNQFSEQHCFADVLSFKDIKRIGGFPRSFFGKFNALCAYVRICIAAIYICCNQDPDVIFCDQISAPLFILRLFSRARLLFYCHFPDQLLTKRESLGKKLYRMVIDSVECWTTGMADVIFVNSHFTESVFRRTFPSLSHLKLEVLYPSLNTAFFDAQLGEREPRALTEILKGSSPAPGVEHIFLSVNRFEVKKNIGLAIRAFGLLRNRLSPHQFGKCLLVVAGGYDPLHGENIFYHKQLVELAEQMGLSESIAFILSPSDEAKVNLFRHSQLVIYTPENEHFGIVPLEAMYLERAVLATNSGGPTETVRDGETGFLCPPEEGAFSAAMLKAIEQPEVIREMGECGKRRVLERFSFGAFTDQLSAIVG